MPFLSDNASNDDHRLSYLKRHGGRILIAFLTSALLLSLIVLNYTNVEIASKVGDGSLHVYNESFGFSEIICISLPSRTDRRDALSLLASAYNVSITYIDGVLGESIANVAMPYYGAEKINSPAHLGSWRSHMNAFKYVIDHKLETALVIEDDTDWDVEVKPQLHAFATGLRSSELRGPWSADELARAPYGLDWDIMHLGPATISSPPPPFDKLGTPYVDENATSLKLKIAGLRTLAWSKIFESTHTSQGQHRVIIPTYRSIGLTSVAVTYDGARRLLHELSFLGENMELGLDYGITKLITLGKLHGWTPVPPLMGQWKIDGPADSDLNKVKGSGSNRQGKTINLGHSAKRELVTLLQRPLPRWNITDMALFE